LNHAEICQAECLKNLIKQDHRFIKKTTKPMMGFKAFHSAQATIDGIETARSERVSFLIKAYLLINGLWL
jgi:putative transposase